MKQTSNKSNKEISETNNLWEQGSFMETMSNEDWEKKKRTFNMKHNEEMNYNCKKCNSKISAHNRDWHASMCDGCFDEECFDIK